MTVLRGRWTITEELESGMRWLTWDGHKFDLQGSLLHQKTDNGTIVHNLNHPDIKKAEFVEYEPN